MAYTFEQILAVDPSNPANVARQASITIFAPGDAAKTPLTLTDTNGSPLPNPLTVNANGFGPAFMHATLDRVAWEGGGFTGFLTSYEGMKEEAVDARSAAESVVTRANNGEFKGDKGDKGDQGDQGLPGVNAVENDTAVAAYINNGASSTRGALNGAVAAQTAGKLDKTVADTTFTRPRGNTIVLTGDSRIAGEMAGSDASTEFRFDQLGAFTWANMELRQRFNVLAETGVTGNTVAQLLARYQTDVLAYQPQNVFVGIGVNSVTTDVPVATIKSEITQIFDLNDSIGAVTIMQTINPYNTHTAPRRAALAELNRWLLSLNRRGVIVIDVTSPVVNATTMDWRTGYTTSGDGLHQNREAAIRMGKRIAEVLAPLYPARDRLPVYAGDTLNLVANPLMDGTGTLATGWVTIGGQTRALVASTDLIAGNWQQMTNATAETFQIRQLSLACPPEWIGRKVAATIEVKFDTLTAMTNLELQCNQMNSVGGVVMATSGPYKNPGDAGALNLALVPGQTTPAVMRTPTATVKAGTATFQFIFQLENFVGTVRVRRASLTLVD